MVETIHIELRGAPCRRVCVDEGASAAEIRIAFADVLPGMRLLLDIRGLRFLDQRILGAIAGAIRRVHVAGAEIALVSDHGPVRRILTLVGIDSMVTVAPDPESVRWPSSPAAEAVSDWSGQRA